MEQAQIDTRKMQYLYADGTDHVFMDMDTYDQISIPGDQIKDELNYLQENMEVSVIQFGSETLGG